MIVVAQSGMLLELSRMTETGLNSLPFGRSYDEGKHLTIPGMARPTCLLHGIGNFRNAGARLTWARGKHLAQPRMKLCILWQIDCLYGIVFENLKNGVEPSRLSRDRRSLLTSKMQTIERARRAPRRSVLPAGASREMKARPGGLASHRDV